MVRPPVDSRLQKIQKSQQRIESMLEKIFDSKTNTDAPDDEDSIPKVKAIECQCSMEADGTVTCPIKKEKFNMIQKMNIKPKRIIFEIE